MGLMAASHDDFRLVFWVAVIPAVVCVLLIAFVVEEPEAARSAAKVQFPSITRASLARLTSRFWWVVAFAAVLTLARFSEAFLLLRAENVGLAATWVPLILIVMNVVYAASAYPFGMLSDKVSGRTQCRAAMRTGAPLVVRVAFPCGQRIHAPRRLRRPGNAEDRPRFPVATYAMRRSARTRPRAR